MTIKKLPHIVLTKPPETSLYTTTTTGGGGEAAPPRNRIPHGQFLQQQMTNAWQQADEELAVSHSTRNGVYIEFQSDPDTGLELQSLENLPKRIRLLNVREVTESIISEDTGEETLQVILLATVYVPHAEKQFFLNKLEQYLNEDTAGGKPKNAKLIDSIADIRKALLVESFWSDVKELIPDDEPEWIEVWLSSHEEDVVLSFKRYYLNRKLSLGMA